jgi:hypothetical protein
MRWLLAIRYIKKDGAVATIRDAAQIRKVVMRGKRLL